MLKNKLREKIGCPIRKKNNQQSVQALKIYNLFSIMCTLHSHPPGRKFVKTLQIENKARMFENSSLRPVLNKLTHKKNNGRKFSLPLTDTLYSLVGWCAGKRSKCLSRCTGCTVAPQQEHKWRCAPFPAALSFIRNARPALYTIQQPNSTKGFCLV